MRSGSIVCVLALLAGCSHEYYMRIEGDVRGADRDTPRSVKADVYESATSARALYDAAAGSLTPLKDGKVSITLRFDDEHEGKSQSAVPVDSRTARFHFESAGKVSEKLTGYTIRVEAPGYEPVERTFKIEQHRRHYEAILMAVLDAGGAPMPGSSSQPPRAR